MATKIKGSNLTDSTFIIPGDLQVDGTTTTINSTTLTVDDKNIVLASGAGNAAAANGAGLTVDGASASLTYASSGDKFSFNKPLDVTGTLTATSLAGTITTAAQTNITSVGTLSSLTTSGNLLADSATITGDLKVDDGEIILGQEAYSISSNFVGLKAANQSGTQDYMIISGVTGGDGNTYISAKSGGQVNIRSGGNNANHELRVTSSYALANGDFAFDSSGAIFFDKSDQALEFGDNYKASFGAGGDLQIYHNGANSVIHDNGTGDLFVRTNHFKLNNAANSEKLLHAIQNGAVELYHNNTKRFETTAVGVGFDQAFGLSDTDTGIALGANGANIMQFYTGNSERVRIDANGKVGIGATPANVLHIKGSSSGEEIFNIDNSAGSGVHGDTNNNIRVTSNNNSHWANLVVGAHMLNVIPQGGASMLAVTTTGVGVGTTSPTIDGALAGVSVPSGSKFIHIDDGDGAYLKLSDPASGSNRGAQFGLFGTTAVLNNCESGNLIFGTGNGERARFTTSQFMVGKTSSGLNNTGHEFATDGYVYHTRNGNIMWLNTTASSANAITFMRSAATAGSITMNSSGTTYNTTSDIRLKQDIEPLEATDKLMAMNPVSYVWKADPDGPRSMGFIAQEMQEVMPEAVSTGDDNMMNMDYGRITPILVSALQDAHKKIEQLEKRITEMEVK